MLLVAIRLKQRVKMTDKIKQRIEKLQYMVFFNPIIRYLLLNSLKLNFTAFIVFKPPLGNAVDIFLGLVMMLLINAVPIFFFYILRKNRDELDQDSKKKAFGTLY